MDLEFHECEACAAKPGSPELCAGCIHNRTIISALSTRLATAEVHVGVYGVDLMVKDAMFAALGSMHRVRVEGIVRALTFLKDGKPSHAAQTLERAMSYNPMNKERWEGWL